MAKKHQIQRVGALEVLLFVHYGDDSDILIVLPTVPGTDSDPDLCQTVSFKTGRELAQNPVSLQTLMQPYAGEEKQAALNFVGKLYSAKVRHVPYVLPRHQKVRLAALQILDLYAEMEFQKNATLSMQKITQKVASKNAPKTNETNT